MEMPEQLGALEASTLKQDLETLLTDEYPQIVFDCRQLRSVDSAGMEMMLQCFEEAIKRDGDLKLAALSNELRATQQFSRVFQAFATSDEAIRSFRKFSPLATNASSTKEVLKKAS
jgi:anti-anti-sigma factor